jgi:diaminopimelate decarboxylase
MKDTEMDTTMEQLSFLSADQVRHIQTHFGTPVFVYDQHSLSNQAQQALAFPNAYGLTVRYAMKACPNAAVIRVFDRLGLHIDASSGYEAQRAMRAGVAPSHIQITAQELPHDLEALLKAGVLFNACSLNQVRALGQAAPGTSLSLRVNPGLGSGHSQRTNVGGPSASFGIWHEHLGAVMDTAAEFDLQVTGLHSHIGSGSDPQVWQRCARMTLDIAAGLPQVSTVSLGGGFKVGRMAGEVSTDLQTAGAPIVAEFERFAAEHGRRLHLEVEPGTFFVANAGAVICTAMDVVDTGSDGYRFIKVDTGMTEVLRPSMYGAQHPIVVVPADDSQRDTQEYLIAGHCCESGDILTPDDNNPDGLKTRRLLETRIGDALFIGGSGAYCAAMSAKNYNSFPEAAEILLDQEGDFHLVRRRQTLDQVLANEEIPPFLAT